MATWSVGSGKSIGGSRRPASRVESVSPVSVTPSFATAPISPARSSAAGSCSLALERAREDAQVRQPPDERVGSGLEYAHQQLAGPGLDRHLVAGLVDRRVRAFLLGRREVPGDGVEQRVEPDALRCGGHQHGRQHRLADALVEARVQLGVRDLLLAEVLLEHVVVGLGRRLEQLVTAACDLVGELGRDLDLDLLAALEPVRLAVDQVDVAAEGVRGADGDVERGDLVAERRAQRVEGRSRIGVLSVALVEDEAGRGPRGPAELDRRLEARLDAARRVDHEQRRVRGMEPLDHLGHEVRVAGRVDERDLVLAVLERPDREAQRPVLLLLLGLVVQVRRAVVDLAQPRDRPGAEQDLLREGGLAGAGVAGEHDAPDVGEVVALQRHRAQFLRSGAMGRIGRW
jgi:hypothetical protein